MKKGGRFFMKFNLKKIALVALLVFIIALAGPVAMNLALGTDTVGVIYAAYPEFNPGWEGDAPWATGLDGCGGGPVNAGGSGGAGAPSFTPSY
jgi:hypothetical protein